MRLRCAIAGCSDEAETITYGFALCSGCLDLFYETEIRTVADLACAERYLGACLEVSGLGGLGFEEGMVSPGALWRAARIGEGTLRTEIERGYAYAEKRHAEEAA